VGSNTIIRRRYRSNLIIGVIFSVAIIAALVSEIYQAPITTGANLDTHLTVLGDIKYDEVVQITIQNKLGTLELSRNSSNDNLWELTSPKQLPANQGPINGLIDALRVVTTRKFYQPDSINMTNFSLENPLASMTFTKNDGTKQIVKQGIINPINRSTYITVLGLNKIIHIDAIEFNPSSLDVSGLINSAIFAIKPSSVTAMKLSRLSRNSHGNIQFEIAKNGERWIDSKNVELNGDDINEYINSLTAIHGPIILDNLDEKQAEEVSKQLESVAYKFDLTLNENNNISYTVSNPIKDFPGLKLVSYKDVMVKASNRPQVYIIDKDKLKSLTQTTQGQFKALQIKKLFY